MAYNTDTHPVPKFETKEQFPGPRVSIYLYAFLLLGRTPTNEQSDAIQHLHSDETNKREQMCISHRIMEVIYRLGELEANARLPEKTAV